MIVDDFVYHLLPSETGCQSRQYKLKVVGICALCLVQLTEKESIYTECKYGRPTIFCLDRFSRKEKQFNNDKDH